MSAKEVGTLEEVELPPDRRDPFADMVDNRLDQDLLMVRNGFNPKKVKQRMTRYRKYLTHPGACSTIVEKYKDQVFQAELAAMNANDSQRDSRNKSVMEEIRNFFRKFGRLPKEKGGQSRTKEESKEESKLAERLRRAKAGDTVTAEQREELEAMKEQEQEEQLDKSRELVEAVMEEIRNFFRKCGRLPKEKAGRSRTKEIEASRAEESKLAERIRDHKKKAT